MKYSKYWYQIKPCNVTGQTAQLIPFIFSQHTCFKMCAVIATLVLYIYYGNDMETQNNAENNDMTSQNNAEK